MTIYGWDMSHFDAPSIGDAVDEGFAFITHKAGGDKDDAEIGAWWSGVKGLGGEVLLGAYWVLYPGSPTARADAFLSRLDDRCPGWRLRPFILQVDCEKWGGDAGTVPPRADIKAFCDRLHAKMPKLKPIVYAPEWVYHDSLTGLGYPLWASAYVTGSGTASALYAKAGGDSSSRWDAYSGQTPAVLQFTSSAVIAGQTTCDANAFRGTLAELTALVAPGWEIDMALTQDDFDKIARAVWGFDPGKGTDGKAVWPGVADPWHPGETQAPGPALGNALAAVYGGGVDRVDEIKDRLFGMDTKVSGLLTTLVSLAQAEAVEVPASAQAIADAVLADLSGQTLEDTAAALVAILGRDKAVALGAKLSAATA